VPDKFEGPSPLVSVIIPVRNGKDYIEEAIESVLSQTFASIEILLIDDGSDDLDYNIFALQDDRIRVIRLEGNGVSHARNTGMALARGKYFAFLDADDVWFPGKLTAQIHFLQRFPEVGIVFGAFIKWTSDADGSFPPAKQLWADCSTMLNSDPARSGWLYTRLLLGLLVGMNTAVIRREVYEKIGGFDESMRYGEDYDFWLRASRITEMHSMAGPVALYRIHGASTMHRLDRTNQLARLLKSANARWGLADMVGNRLTPKDFKYRVANTYFDHGYSHYWSGDPIIAFRSFAKSFIGGSRRTRSLVYCTLSALKFTEHSLQFKSRGAINDKSLTRYVRNI
jgi:glycosyltransferase involved in cell wall biosynthesis